MEESRRRTREAAATNISRTSTSWVHGAGRVTGSRRRATSRKSTRAACRVGPADGDSWSGCTCSIKAPDYSCLRLFACVCYMLLVPHEHTKLTAQSAESVFLGYSAEHKGYHCWDMIARWMRVSWDVVFDEAHSFYSCPSFDALSTSLVDPISFLYFLDARVTIGPASRLVRPR